MMIFSAFPLGNVFEEERGKKNSTVLSLLDRSVWRLKIPFWAVVLAVVSTTAAWLPRAQVTQIITSGKQSLLCVFANHVYIDIYAQSCLECCSP